MKSFSIQHFFNKKIKSKTQKVSEILKRPNAEDGTQDNRL